MTTRSDGHKAFLLHLAQPDGRPDFVCIIRNLTFIMLMKENLRAYILSLDFRAEVLETRPCSLQPGLRQDDPVFV